MPTRTTSVAVALLATTLTACAVTTDQPAEQVTADHEAAGQTDASTAHPDEEQGTAEAAASEGATDREARPSAYALALLVVPQSATHLTVTDYDAVRTRLGVPGLTSQDLMTDRLEFWRAAEATTVLLTDGLLRPENSRYDLTYDFTQDDVDAEVRWTGDAGAGFLLALRPGLDLDLVVTAVEDGAPGLNEAVLDPVTATVRSDGEPADVWAMNPVLAEVGDLPAESLIVRAGCVPFGTALGVEATVEDQQAVLADHDVAALEPVEAVAIGFTADRATVRLAYAEGAAADVIEADLQARLALVADWPTTEAIGFADGFGDGAVTGVDGTTGELEYAVANPAAAANLALADLVPVGVCSEVEPLAEPTGL